MRRQLLIQNKMVRARDCEQFYLKGTVLPDTLTIHELMHNHSPVLDPKTDTIQTQQPVSV